VLQRLVGTAAFAAAGAATARSAKAAAGNPLDALIDDGGGARFGQSFDDAPRSIRMPSATVPTLSPQTEQFTEQAIGVYDGIVARGGWPQVPTVEELHLGMRHPTVRVLRDRLSISGDLDANAVRNDIYDSYVEAAVRRFQLRHGLRPNGVLRAVTLDAMNVPATTRRDQLKINVTRLKKRTVSLTHRYVVVNIPAQRVEAVDGGVTVSRYVAVVGRPTRPSPVFDPKIINVNFNPYWTVPTDLVRKDLIPIMQKSPDYLVQNHIRIFDSRHNEVQASQINWYSEDAVHYTFRQDPGGFNALGRMRLNLAPDPYDVYMHDTSEKNLFADQFRYDSSGCVRVQNVRQLVYWVLDESKDWPPEAIDTAIESGKQITARLARPVQAHWIYITAWSGPDGIVQFREDIYDRDGVGALGVPRTAQL
jgi:murein L,D-transpeptidase YcbB/YkuD